LGGGPFSPRVQLFGELGPAAARDRAARRLEAFIAAEASRRLSPLRELKAAVAEGRLKGLARGLAYRLLEAGGVIDRRAVETEVRALSPAERRALRSFGVRFGEFSLFIPTLLTAEARVFTAAFARMAAPEWAPTAGALCALPDPPPPTPALAFRGLRAVAGLAAPVEALEALGEALRAAPKEAGGSVLDEAAFAALGWSPGEAQRILRGLDFAPARKPKPGLPAAWRRRRAPQPKPAAEIASPFAALAGLSQKPAPQRRRRRRRPA
jgi:ATP-dependent RNA helicase SUPV3L1/SUV3